MKQDLLLIFMKTKVNSGLLKNKKLNMLYSSSKQQNYNGNKGISYPCIITLKDSLDENSIVNFSCSKDINLYILFHSGGNKERKIRKPNEDQFINQLSCNYTAIWWHTNDGKLIAFSKELEEVYSNNTQKKFVDVFNTFISKHFTQRKNINRLSKIFRIVHYPPDTYDSFVREIGNATRTIQSEQPNTKIFFDNFKEKINQWYNSNKDHNDYEEIVIQLRNNLFKELKI